MTDADGGAAIAAPGQGDGDADDVQAEQQDYGVPLSWSADQPVLHPDRTAYVPLVERLRGDGFETCSDLCGVDYVLQRSRVLPPEVVPERFEVVVNLLSVVRARRLRVRVQVPEADPTVDSLFGIYPGTEAMEREVFDMFGIRFRGHPDLTRILMPEDWEGHPLRKDYSAGRIPVRFKEAPGAR